MENYNYSSYNGYGLNENGTDMSKDDLDSEYYAQVGERVDDIYAKEEARIAAEDEKLEKTWEREKPLWEARELLRKTVDELVTLKKKIEAESDLLEKRLNASKTNIETISSTEMHNSIPLNRTPSEKMDEAPKKDLKYLGHSNIVYGSREEAINSFKDK